MTRSAAALLLAGILPAAGCGYTVGPPQTLGGARTVALPIFENRTYRRGIEADLARALVTEVHARSRLRVVDAGADLVLEGSIVDCQEIVLSQDEHQTIRESTVLVTVEYVVKDGRTGEPVRPRDRVTEREAFVPGIGESIRTARAEALRRLAADLVDRLAAD